jgi:hypothetical protein
MTIFEIVANITTGYDRNYFDWIVQLYGFDLNESNTFYFILELEGNGVYTSAFFNITSQSGSSSTTSTPTLGSTATSASVPAIVTLTLTATSSSSPSSARFHLQSRTVRESEIPQFHRITFYNMR